LGDNRRHIYGSCIAGWSFSINCIYALYQGQLIRWVTSTRSMPLVTCDLIYREWRSDDPLSQGFSPANQVGVWFRMQSRRFSCTASQSRGQFKCYPSPCDRLFPAGWRPTSITCRNNYSNNKLNCAHKIQTQILPGASRLSPCNNLSKPPHNGLPITKDSRPLHPRVQAMGEVSG
jgi:hypothetical protein